MMINHEIEKLKQERNNTLLTLRRVVSQITEPTNPFDKNDEWLAHQMWCVVKQESKSTFLNRQGENDD